MISQTLRRPLCGVLLSFMLGGCGTTPPTHYYTLLPAAAAASTASAAPALQFELQAVDLPAQVDRAEIVVRQGGELTPVDTRQWAAPLGNELQNAFSVALAQRLGARDVFGLPHDAALPTYRIKLSVQRFDSVLGDSARIDASWSVQRVGDKSPTVCSSSVSKNVGPGYEALAAGHQKAIDAIAGQIAQSLNAVVVGHGAVRCPA